MSRDDVALVDILGAAKAAVAYLGNADRSALEKDGKTQSAVIHQLLIVGEAVKRLSLGFRSDYPGVPWKSMAGMRDRLIHEYDEVDLNEVWKTVRFSLPPLITALEGIITDRGVDRA